jgi:hypothetical protein
MPKQNLRGTYLYRGNTYGPGEVDIPSGEDFDMLRETIKRNEPQIKVTTEQQIDELVRTLPEGHPYLTLFAARNSQPEAFEGDAANPNPVPGFPGGANVALMPAGFTVSGEKQEGALAPDDEEVELEPRVAGSTLVASSAPPASSGPVVTGGTKRPATTSGSGDKDK